MMIIIDVILALFLIVLALPVFFWAASARQWEFTGRWVALSWVLIFAINILFPEMEHIHLGLFCISVAAIGGRVLGGDIRLG